MILMLYFFLYEGNIFDSRETVTLLLQLMCEDHSVYNVFHLKKLNFDSQRNTQGWFKSQNLKKLSFENKSRYSNLVLGENFQFYFNNDDEDDAIVLLSQLFKIQFIKSERENEIISVSEPNLNETFIFLKILKPLPHRQISWRDRNTFDAAWKFILPVLYYSCCDGKK